MRHRNRGAGHETARHLEAFVDDDEFLTALSRGEDPSSGTDELAALLLDLRAQVERPMPPAPEIDGADDIAGESAQVVDLADARRRRRGPGPLLSGLIGAAAATVIVAGSGAALYNASPGSPLWGASTALFGERTTVLELAGTLDELEVANEKGDVNGARDLLNQARALINAISGAEGDSKRPAVKDNGSDGATVTVTQTVQAPTPTERPAEPAESASPAQPETPMEVTVTQTVTTTVPTRQPTTGAESTSPTASTATSSTTTVPESAVVSTEPAQSSY